MTEIIVENAPKMVVGTSVMIDHYSGMVTCVEKKEDGSHKYGIMVSYNFEEEEFMSVPVFIWADEELFIKNDEFYDDENESNNQVN